jgi:effector-binding domain-containing protein
MKIVKYVFLLLVLAAIALTVFIATQNGTYTVTEEKIINVPRPVLYNYVSEYKNWKNLGMLSGADSTATYAFSQRSAGPGAFMKWDKNNDGGKITTIAVAENDSIGQQATVNGLESKLSWTFKDTLSSTKVMVTLTGNLTFSEKAEALLKGGINNAYEKNLAGGLDNLNAYLVTELKTFDAKVAGVVNKVNAFYLGTSAEGKTDKAAIESSAKFSQLYDFAKQNNIAVKGAPFIIYNKVNKTAKTAKYTYAIQLKEAIYTAAGSEYESGELIGFKALKTSLRGDYSHLPKAWKKAEEHIGKNALPENTTGQYVEVFSKNPLNTRRPSQWVTDIYIPIGHTAVNDSLNGPVLPPINNATTQPIPATVRPATIKPAQNSTVKPAATPATGKPNTASSTNTKPATSATTKPAAASSVKAGTATANTATTRTATTPTRTAGNITVNRPAATSGTTRQPATGNSTTATPRRTTTAPATSSTPKPRAATTRTTVRNNTEDGLNPPKAN